MTRLILTRHGETIWNLEKKVQGFQDSPLSQLGIAQAKALAKRLKSEGITKLYSSDLPRAHHTALEIGREIGLADVKTMAGLREMSFGQWEGKQWDSLRDDDALLFAQWENEPHLVQLPDGELMSDVLRRAWLCLEEIIHMHPNETVCIVSHGITVKLLITKALGYEMHQLFETPWQHNTAVNIFEVENGLFNSILVADCAHLESKEV